MKTIMPLLALLLAARTATAQADGRELTPPRYDEIVFFAALVAGAPIPVRVGARWGYLNDQGEEIIAPQFDAAGDFHDGLAQVSIRGQPPRYIRRDGTYISAPYGSDGMGIPDGALERIPYRQNKQWGLIDLHGRVITPPRFRLRHDIEAIVRPLFWRGVAVVYLAENWPREEEVLIDRDGCVLARRSSFFDDGFELLSLTPDQP